MSDSNRTTWSPGKAGLIAGISLLLMAVVAGFGNFGALEPLIVAGDATTTAQNILASEMLFRVGVACMVITAILDLIVSVALYRVFATVHRDISTMAAVFRIAYTAALMVSLSELASVPALAGDPERALQAYETYISIWHTGLILFAVHLLLIAYLAFRSGFVHQVFGILLAIAGLGYLADGIGLVLVPGYSISVGAFTFIGEVAIILWLLVWGRRLDATPKTEVPSHAPVV